MLEEADDWARQQDGKTQDGVPQEEADDWACHEAADGQARRKMPTSGRAQEEDKREDQAQRHVLIIGCS